MAKTNNLPSDPADESLLEAETGAIKTVVDGIQTDLDNGSDGLGALKALLDAITLYVDCLPASLGDIVEKNEAGVIDNIWDEDCSGIKI